jgi:hypothetical protein
MREVVRRKGNEDFWRRKIACWETKRRYDQSLVWDGEFRWFKSSNVVRLEDYRDLAEMERIRESILKPAKMRAKYAA